MAKLHIALLASLCLFSFLSITSADIDDQDRFHIQGSVYCDPCRVQFVTRLSKYLKGAKVALECRHRENKNIVLQVDATTNEAGIYTMDVTGDHEEEICEIVLKKSPDPECTDINNEEYLRSAARVSLTANDGMVSNETRIVNPLGFMRKSPLPECKDAFKELGMIPDAFF